MMATLAEVDGETYLFVKGAPENRDEEKCIIEDRMPDSQPKNSMSGSIRL